MTMSRIVIDQQIASVGIRSTPAKMNLTVNKRQMTDLKTETSKPEITGTKPPSFHQNFIKLMSEIGNKSPSAMAADWRAKGKQYNMELISQTVKDGEFLGATELGGNRAVELVKQQNAPEMRETNIGLLPPNPPEIEWEKPSLRIDWSGNGVKIEWNSDYMPNLEIDPRVNVEVYLRNRPYIRITVEQYSTDSEYLSTLV